MRFGPFDGGGGGIVSAGAAAATVTTGAGGDALAAIVTVGCVAAAPQAAVKSMQNTNARIPPILRPSGARSSPVLGSAIHVGGFAPKPP